MTDEGETRRSGEQGFPDYVGSERCKECHEAIWRQWRLTLHARNYRDAKRDPAAILGVFTGDEPFPKDDVLRTVGEHWTQRYLVQGKKELMVVPDTWSIQTGAWVQEGSFNRPWLKYCAGCHVTGLNPFDGNSYELGTGCEGCHGPGRRHAESSDQTEIVNPAVLVESRRDMICESCHTAGHDRSGNFRYPVGYRPGDDLMRYYRGLVPKPGQDISNYKGDNSYEDRHRQFLFAISRMNILSGATCDVCSAAAARCRRGGEGPRVPADARRDVRHLPPRDQEEPAGARRPRAGGRRLHRLSRAAARLRAHRATASTTTSSSSGRRRPSTSRAATPAQGCHERRRVKGKKTAGGRREALSGDGAALNAPGWRCIKAAGGAR